MAEKIKNLGTTITESQILTEWSIVMSRKNKLLESSDWTQLNDVYLSRESKTLWREWRQKLRRINRNAYLSSEAAIPALDALESSKPTDTNLREELFSADNNSTLLVGQNKTIEKVFIKEQPIILQERITLEDLRILFVAAYKENSDDLRGYLQSILQSKNEQIIFDFDDFTTAQFKVRKYLLAKQKLVLANFFESVESREILLEKLDEALEYLTIKSPDINNYPFIKLYVDLYDKSPDDVALDFIDAKKSYNKFLIDVEKFYISTLQIIDNCDNIDTLKNTIKVIDGY